MLGAPAPIVLRDYQEKAKAAVLAAKDRGLQRVMVVMPTGAGKTTLFSSLVDEFEGHYRERSLVIAHRHELLQQAARRISVQAPRLMVEIEGGSHKARLDAHAVVAAVQTIGRPNTNRLEGFHPGLMIIDEAHHAPADTWQRAMRRFGAYDGVCFAVGVTATDHRMDNKPLHGDGTAIFEDVVFRYTLREAVQDGWLVDLRGYRVATATDLSKVRKSYGDYHVGELARAVNTELRNDTAISHWESIAHDRPTIVFCVDIQHAKDVAEMFRARGIHAESIDGTMRMVDREAVVDRFTHGKTQVLTNVDVATEGFDIPIASCVLMLRPTQSWALYTQMVGRGLRVLPNVVDGEITSQSRREAVNRSAKPDCIVIDVVDVTVRAERNEDTGTVPEGKAEQPASVAGLMGLPSDFDLQGESAFAAAVRAEGLGPAKRAEMFRRPTNWEDLSTVLEEIDLLRELSIPEEVLGVSRLAWMKIGQDRYYLACGSSGLEQDRFAQINSDELGRYTLTIGSSLMPEMRSPVGTELERAFDEADRMIRIAFPDCGQIVRADATWREKPPSDKQIEQLRRFGVDNDAIQALETMGQAHMLIQQRKIGYIRARKFA